jgi:Co/Zn/Cd efflux system component
MTSESKSSDVNTSEERKVLIIVLALNAILAIALTVTGVTADSSALIANALDNGSDVLVYAISLVAVGRTMRWKRIAATASGILLLLFALLILIDTIRRFLTGSEPIGPTMMVMALIAAVVNLICLKLLMGLKVQDVNLRAAETFSANDFIANGGILVAGFLVAWLGQSWPDLVVGLGVVAIAAKGGIDILRDAQESN